MKAWNPWHGCIKYSEGCQHCYMYALDKARGVPEKSSQIVRTSNFYLPIQRNRSSEYKIKSNSYIFVNMTSDTFIEQADPWRDEFWDIIRQRPDVMFYIITKRVPRIKECLPGDWGEGWENVDFNITCENQRAFDERWPIFEKIPAKHKGIRLEPLIGPVDITPALESGQIEYAAVGGENYDGCRPCNYSWVKQISDDCLKFNVNFTFDSTGNIFIKDNKTYHIDKKHQVEQAYKSKLSHILNKREFKLDIPQNTSLFKDDNTLNKLYNLDKCSVCPRFELCDGCSNCGSCKKIKACGSRGNHKD